MQPSAPTATSEGRNWVGVSMPFQFLFLTLVCVHQLKSVPLNSFSTLVVQKSWCFSCHVAPFLTGWYPKMVFLPASAARSRPSHLSPRAPFS